MKKLIIKFRNEVDKLLKDLKAAKKDPYFYIGSFIFASLIIGVFIGAAINTYRLPKEKKKISIIIRQKNEPIGIITTIPATCCGNQTDTVYLYVIHGSEYTGSLNKPTQSDWLTHKGDCNGTFHKNFKIN